MSCAFSQLKCSSTCVFIINDVFVDNTLKLVSLLYLYPGIYMQNWCVGENNEKEGRREKRGKKEEKGEKRRKKENDFDLI